MLPAGMSPNVAVCEPFAIALDQSCAHQFCNFCLNGGIKVAMKRCTACEFVWYCSKDCQRADWKPNHKAECKLLKGQFDEWTSLEDGQGLSEIALLTLRTYLLNESGKLQELKGEFTDKTFANLMSHKKKTQKNRDSMERFTQVKDFITETLKKPVDKDILFDIFCKLMVNFHSITKWYDMGRNVTIGSSFHLDMSAYDHSCRPNCEILWVGRKAYVMPTDGSHDAHNTQTSFVSYIHLMEPRQFRRRELMNNYYFNCACSRCQDPTDHLSTAILCNNCANPVPVDSQLIGKDKSFEQLACPNCSTVQPENWTSEAVLCMTEIADTVGTLLNPSKSQALRRKPFEEQKTILANLKGTSDKYLPKCNLFRGLLAKLYAEYVENGEMALLLLEHLEALKLCFPANYSQHQLDETLKVCHVLTSIGAFKKARLMLDPIQQLISHTFAFSNCPFKDRVDYLTSMIGAQSNAMSYVAWEHSKLYGT